MRLKHDGTKWLTWAVENLLAEHQQWILWTPVWLAAGIGIYFSLYNEPALWVGGALILKASLLFYLLRKWESGRPLLIGLMLIAVGFSAAQFRTWSVQSPLLTHKMKGQYIIGSVVSVEKKPDKWYAILEDLEGLKFNKVRFTLRGKVQQSVPLHPGDRIKAKVALMPPSSPPTPEVYNFRKRAYFMGIGAVGYALEVPKIIAKNPSTFDTWLQTLRETITQKIQKGVGGQEGAIAAALVTGDRSGISESTRDAFANAGIAHILAISGLHLAIVAGFVFLIIRRGLCLFQSFALRYSTKKIAALFTMLLTTFYVMLCWQSIPARRAYLMTSIVMLAILVDRSALSLRNVMFAATVILLFLPESLLGPSFQLSFAAVIALIAAYESLQEPLNLWRYEGGKVRSLLIYFISIMGTTVIATVATTPYTIFTFNQYTLHSVWSNLIAIPITSLWVMPAEVLTVLLLPFGLDQFVFPLLKEGVGLLKSIAFEVSSWPNAALYVPKSAPWIVVMVSIGGLWLCLWRQRWRYLGVIPLSLGFFLLLTPKATDLYVEGSGDIIGLREGKALYLSSLRKSKFTAHLWQKHAGNLDLKHLSAHEHVTCEKGTCQGKVGETSFTLTLPYAQKYKPCRKGDIYINLQNWKKCGKARRNITRSDLRRRGGVIFRENHYLTVNSSIGRRPWG